MTLDKALVEALEKDYTTAPITQQDRVMLDYVVKLTKDATKVGKGDHERLRAVGFRRPRHPADHADRGLVQLHQPRRGRPGRGPGVE